MKALTPSLRETAGTSKELLVLQAQLQANFGISTLFKVFKVFSDFFLKVKSCKGKLTKKKKKQLKKLS